ncbi:MAG TPA: DinB family protein [Pyrinomonadaceae bacterium]|nr:DinB family protein [Pyrinomonadaceae bacterium]
MRRRLLISHPGLATNIGYYLSGMEEVRGQLSAAVKTIPDDLIGKPAFLGAHSIGGLVLHIGEAEWFWMKMIVSGQELTEEVKNAPYWDILDDLERVARNGYTAEFCLSEIEKIRNQTRDVLFSYNDKDLERIITFERKGQATEYNLRYILHHLIDHEAQHKGQIFMLKRLMALG